MRERCRVYWGSHGCDLPGGHGGRHRCACADDPCDCDDEGCCEDCPRDGRCIHNVGAYPYYGLGNRVLRRGRAALPIAPYALAGASPLPFVAASPLDGLCLLGPPHAAAPPIRRLTALEAGTVCSLAATGLPAALAGLLAVAGSMGLAQRLAGDAWLGAEG